MSEPQFCLSHARAQGHAGYGINSFTKQIALIHQNMQQFKSQVMYSTHLLQLKDTYDMCW